MGVVVTTLAQWLKENPEIATEWDSEANSHIDPQIQGYSIKSKAWWICPEGHHYDMMLQSRTLDGQGCPYCKGKRTLAGYNDLATTRPDVLSRWDYEKNTSVTPQQVTASSHREVFWKCEKGHSWQARVQSITGLKAGSTGCPYCNGKRAEKGGNDLATLRPDVAAQWCYEKNELTPDQVTVGSKRRVWWQCAEGHKWQAIIYSRTGKNGSGCPVCSRKQK